MNIAIIGTGYVGLPSGVGFAQLGNVVYCIDKDQAKIDSLNNGEITLYEDGLDDLFRKNVAAGRLFFTSDFKQGVYNADLVILAVGTPPDPVTHEADLSYMFAAAKELALNLNQDPDHYTVIANKSTVPVGTGDRVEALIRENNPVSEFDVVSLPEFLREGFAVHDFFHPDRIIVGSNSERASALIARLYEPFSGVKAIYVKRRSSELIKYASNAFLAIKIHYINEMANFCEKCGADIGEVALGMGLDSRIGPKFLNAGPGYGGSCFPKDTMAMDYMAVQQGINVTLVKAAIEGNINRKKAMAARILDAVKDLDDPLIAVLGLAFKNGTDDCRKSPAMDIVYYMLEKQANIVAYDPKAMDNAKKLVGDKIKYARDEYDALKGADVLAVLTEWDEFSKLDLVKAASLMRHKRIVDLRNLLDKKQVLELGFTYRSIGR